ncbi:Transposon Ty3-G Gag-Pol polyprotein [Labeo rohita]|uniref:ribonuclease H n=1 Tax=Labeo rohita TaxID=84645 RepID=A0ABQ8MQY9_LABRO|nr:Transposon Ty3-G Gag-Pol polyprotein [Labeo rohita]
MRDFCGLGHLQPAGAFLSSPISTPADLLKELDEGEEIKDSDIAELRRTADLALRTTKETARVIGSGGVPAVPPPPPSSSRGCWAGAAPAVYQLLIQGGAKAERCLSLSNLRVVLQAKKSSTKGSPIGGEAGCSTSFGETVLPSLPVLQYFIVPKKDGGLRPILDLRVLNRSVMKLMFKMLTVKQVVSQIRSEDWFVTIDLKDAYFHVSILPQHRKFLRFAFRGEAYQYRVLPFGLALSPRTFTKCVDAALAPLRLQGICVLNYIDDWLILAQSEQVAAQHRDVVLTHMKELGLRLNAKKSVLSPSQRTTYLGVVWDSTTMRAHLRDHHVLVRTDNTAVVSYINHQGGLRSRPLYKLAHQILVWSQDKLLSLRAVYVPGYLNLGADILSRQGPRPGEWMLHPEVFIQLPWGWMPWYRRGRGFVCTPFTNRSAPGSSRESAPGRGFPRPSSPVLAGPSLVLGPDFSPRRLSMGDSRQEGSLLTGRGHHPPPLPGAMEALGVASEGAHLLASGLSTEVVETILQSRAPSTRKLFALKWKLFTSWCGRHQQDPVNCPIGTVLEFLQDRLSAELTHSTLNVYMAAIAAYHAPLGGLSVGKKPLVTHFLRGALRLRPPVRPRVPSCLLSSSLPGARPAEAKLYVSSSSAGHICPQSCHVEEVGPTCMFVCYGLAKRGLPATKQTLSRWIVDAISCAYESSGLPPPLGVKAHSTRSIAASKAFLEGVSMISVTLRDGTWILAAWASRSHSVSTRLNFLKGNVSGYVCNPGSPRERDAASRGHAPASLRALLLFLKLTPVQLLPKDRPKIHLDRSSEKALSKEMLRLWKGWESELDDLQHIA